MVGREERAKLLREWQESPQGIGIVVKCAVALLLLVLVLVAGVYGDPPLNTTRMTEPAASAKAGEEMIESGNLPENGALLKPQTPSRESAFMRTPDSETEQSAAAGKDPIQHGSKQ